MRISFLWADVECCSWRSRAALERHLNSIERSKMIIESNDQEREFYSIIVDQKFQVATNIQRMSLGICSEGIGIQPQILLIPEFNALLVGSNNQIVAVDVVTGKIVFRIQLECTFYAMTYLNDRQIVLVIGEIEIMAFDINGRMHWNFFTNDIIQDTSIENELLYLSFMDDEPITLDITSGEKVGDTGRPQPAKHGAAS